MFNFLTVFAQGEPTPADTNYGKVVLGFHVPNISEILTFGLRFFFIIAGLIALLYLLLGALAWITSGGNKESVDKAREKIQAAVIGLIVLFAVLAVVVVIENVFFIPGQGLGLSKPIVFPGLIQPGSN
jgi:cytochrome bd-type quinol oxidase subunit 2